MKREFDRIVIGVDPAVTSSEDADETGIIVAARDSQSPPHFYVMKDLSLRATPDAWAQVVADAFDTYAADRVVAEVNQGGDLVENVIRQKKPNIPIKKVRATRGKILRAEPIGALYEQGRVHHVGVLPTLEEQMISFTPGSTSSPDRLDALVWAITELADGLEGRLGWVEFLKNGFGLRELLRAPTPAPPPVEVLTPKPTPVATSDLRCPECDSRAVARCGSGYRCNQCAAQWGDRQEIQRGPNRNEIFSGAWRRRTRTR